MKVFHIVTHLDLGGAERVAINIAKSDNPDIEYHIVEVVRGKSDFTKQLISELKSCHINVHRSPVSSKKLGIVLFPLWFILIYLRFKPNVIHTHPEIPDLSIYLFHFLFPWHKVYIRTIHNTELWNDWKWIGTKVERFFISHHSNVAISKSVLECYGQNYHPSSDIPLIYNGVSETVQIPFPHLVKDKRNILFAGRLEKQKGIDALINVINRLKDDGRYFFHIVGSGSLRQDLTKLQGNNYKLYDKIYGLSGYIGSFDYMFMPSNFEGFGLVALEACLSKTPTIINACKGLIEVFPSDWPLKVHNNSINDFIEIFSKQLPDIYITSLADIAYEYAKAHFSIKQMQNGYEKLYYERIQA